MGEKESKWLEHLKAAESSGLKLSAYAANHQIDVRRLYEAKFTHAIPPHTSQAAQHRTAQQPNTHRPASSKLSFELVKCGVPATPSARAPKQLQYATLGLLHEILHGVFFIV